MATLKNTPLVSAIGLQDLIRVAGEAGQNTKLYFQFFMISLSIYLVIAALMLLLQAKADALWTTLAFLGVGSLLYVAASAGRWRSTK